MIRALVLVALVGFVTSVICISAAVTLGGPQALFHDTHVWGWRMGRHMGSWDVTIDDGPKTQRDFAWTNSDRLEVNAPADIDYVQAPGPAKLVISGPADELDAVEVKDGRISLKEPGAHFGGLHISLQAPAVTHFALNGAGRLDIKGYRQDALDVEVAGHATVEAEGEAKTLNLAISGAGEADLGKVKAQGADLDISGAGQVTAAPTQWARVRIAGVGDVNLLTRPPKLETHIAGAGRVHQPGAPDRGADEGDGGPERRT